MHYWHFIFQMMIDPVGPRVDSSGVQERACDAPAVERA